MIRKAIMFVVVAGAMTAALVASSAIAGNAPSGPSTEASPCPPGGPPSCFAPFYTAVGQVSKYSGPLATTVEFADCCIAGDTYKGQATGPSGRGAVRWTSVAPLDFPCDPWPHPDTHTVVVAGGATKASLKAIALPGGVPAAAMVGISAAGWTQTAGNPDTCGF